MFVVVMRYVQCSLHTVHVNKSNGLDVQIYLQASNHDKVNLAYSATETSYTIEIWQEQVCHAFKKCSFTYFIQFAD